MALKPLFDSGEEPSSVLWQKKRSGLIERWMQALGAPSDYKYDSSLEIVERFEFPEFKGTLFLQRSGPRTRQKVLLMEPHELKRKAPGCVVPFYHPDASCGYDLDTKKRTEPIDYSVAFGLHLVKQGYIVVATEAYPFNLLPPEKITNNTAHDWGLAAELFNSLYPGWTGMGKLTYDTRLAVDLLASNKNIDINKIAMIGHSLGGKMAFYAGCLDERVKAVICSDFGIGWDYTNWSSPWYFGMKLERIRGAGLEHHQLLAINAPASFMLIGGEFDHEGSVEYINEAKKVYSLFNAENALEFINHKTGHRPTLDALRQSYVWLAEKLGIPLPVIKL